MRRAIAGVGIIVTICSVSLAAQWPKHPTPGVPRDADGRVRMDAPTPRTSDGKPDLSGNWIRVRGEGAFAAPELSGLVRDQAATQTPAPPVDPTSPPIATFWEIRPQSSRRSASSCAAFVRSPSAAAGPGSSCREPRRVASSRSRRWTGLYLSRSRAPTRSARSLARAGRETYVSDRPETVRYLVIRTIVPRPSAPSLMSTSSMTARMIDMPIPPSSGSRCSSSSSSSMPLP